MYVTYLEAFWKPKIRERGLSHLTQPYTCTTCSLKTSTRKPICWIPPRLCYGNLYVGRLKVSVSEADCHCGNSIQWLPWMLLPPSRSTEPHHSGCHHASERRWVYFFNTSSTLSAIHIGICLSFHGFFSVQMTM